MVTVSTIKQSAMVFTPSLSLKGMALPIFAVMLPVTMIVCIGIGAASIHPTDVIRILMHHIGFIDHVDVPAYYESVVISIRLPRVLLGALVGGCMGVCGAALQAMFRNPLAEPGLVGVSSGSAFAAVGMTFYSGTVISLFGELGFLYLMPISAFCGGIVTTVFVYLLATKESQTDVATMLLAGIAVNALASAGIGIFVFASDDQQVRAILFWLFGSLGGALWDTLLPAIPIILGSIFAIIYFSYSLNLYLLGEREASHLGVNVQRMKWILILLVALGVGSSVALSGIIAFVGLVVPHLIRLVIGPDNRLLLPCSAFLGGILLLGADVIARTIVSPTELPIGLVTSMLGSPFFLFLLIKQRRRVRL